MPQNHNRNNGRVSIVSSNKGRRIFRGRCGPKDGHIPHPTSTKRRAKPETNKYDDDPTLLVADQIQTDKNSVLRKQESFSVPQQQEQEGFLIILKEDETNKKIVHKSNSSITSEKPLLFIDSDNNDKDENESECSKTYLPPNLPGERDDKKTKEINHLRERISNIQESIKLSKLALCNPQNWENNCLNAISNCVGEWRSIVSFYASASNNDSNNIHDDGMIKKVALQIFELVQMGMQCGPLTGCKPGYFKRCGSEVAKIAHRFLLRTVAGDSIIKLNFSERQSKVVAKWIVNAEKVIADGKPPTKSSLKLQHGKNKKITLKDKKKQQKEKR